MDAERHRRIQELFHDASAIDPGKRPAFLEEACGSDVDLREAVLSLLRHDGADEDFIEEVVAEAKASHSAKTAGTNTPRGVEVPSVPPQLGSYRIVRELGRGGMGAVYIAEDSRLERRVALKVLPSALAEDPVHQARFEREARLLAAVNHPNIATIHSLEDCEGTFFLTMEWVDGCNLSEHLRKVPLAVADALSLARQVASALEVAHQRGIIHRDLKPQNVAVTPEGTAKVLDFGLAKTVQASRGVTTKPEVMGTPGYMSPEQLRGADLDHRVDIWAFGCLLFECLAGQPAFHEASIPDTIAATMRSEPHWDRLPRETPPAIRELLKQCLAKNVDERLSQITDARRVIEGEIVLRSIPHKRSRRGRGPDRCHNLPLQLSSFVGRRNSIEEVQNMLRQHRLVTLTGVGGVGKTRLALEVAERLLEEFPDGVWLVELAPLKEPSLVSLTAANEIGARVHEEGSIDEALMDELSGKRTLLVLDNCEHLLTACAEFARMLLQRLESLRILATSREKLALPGEMIYPVPPLALPTLSSPIPLAELSESEAITLFRDRASAEGTGFTLNDDNVAAVVEICQRLDGIPLAIELAAARVRVLPPEEISRRLNDRFRLLTSSGRASLPRHRTLNALIDWSYDQLSEAERRLLRRLSVFAGAWSLDVAESVCSGVGIESWEILDLLTQLVDKSLVEIDEGGSEGGVEARYRMLETVREYAVERLREAQEEAIFERRHLEYFVDLAERAEPYLRGPEQGPWLSQLETEHENIRVALETGTSEPEFGIRLATALDAYWEIRASLSEGRAHCVRLLSAPNAPQNTKERAHLLDISGYLAYRQGDYPEARRFLREAIQIQREVDESGLARALIRQGMVFVIQGEFPEANSCYEESLEISRRRGDGERVAMALLQLGDSAYREQRYSDAKRLIDECLEMFRKQGVLEGIARGLGILGKIARSEGRNDEARSYLEESIPTWKEMGDDHGVAGTLDFLGLIATDEGEHDRAHRLHTESLRVRWGLRDKYCTACSLQSFGILASGMGQHARAARLLGATEALRHKIQTVIAPVLRAEFDDGQARVAAELDDETLNRAWSEGAAMEWEQAVAYALSEGDLQKHEGEAGA